FMLALDTLIWWVIRYYERTGVVLAFPKHIYREKTPRWFRFNIISLWGSFGLCVAFTLVATVIMFLVD
ncbi:MAG: hypothetical protein ABIQ98_06195, partial [Sphingomicrobium sp.]